MIVLSVQPSNSPINFRFDGLVERGCFDGENITCDAMSECHTCREDNCNTHMYIKGSCLSCHTTLNGRCATDRYFLNGNRKTVDRDNSYGQFSDLLVLTEGNETLIDTDCPIYYNVPLCYMIFGKGMVHRGCTAKLYRPMFQELCGRELECHYCDYELCNYWREVPEGFQGDLKGYGRGSVLREYRGLLVLLLVLVISEWTL